jgi:release factor glutamine methyltransferase
MPDDVTTQTESLAAAMAAQASRMPAHGVPTPRTDAIALFAESLSVSPQRLALAPHAHLNADQMAAVGALVLRRCAREPLAYILGRVTYRGLVLDIEPDVGIPGPGADPLVELANELPRESRVHDVGTGSGAIALAIKNERPDLQVSASDVSSAVLAVAQRNTTKLALDIRLLKASGTPSGSYDLVVCAPPWADEPGAVVLPPDEAQYEPRDAVYRGGDGLAVIRDVISGTTRGTRIALLHAPAQATGVGTMLDDVVELDTVVPEIRMTVGSVP